MPVIYNQAALTDTGHLTEYIVPDRFRDMEHESYADNGINGLAFKWEILSITSDHALHQTGLAKSFLRHLHHLSGEISTGKGDFIIQKKRKHPPGAAGDIEDTLYLPSKVSCC